MTDQEIDTLIIGGPQLLITSNMGTVRQVEFSFSGLAETYKLWSKCKTVILYLSESIFDDFPNENDFKKFNVCIEDKDGVFLTGINPIVYTLELADEDEVNKVDNQIADNLRIIKYDKDKQEAFVERSALVFFKTAFAGFYKAIRNHINMFICIPDNYPQWPQEHKSILSYMFPELKVEYTSQTNDHFPIIFSYPKGSFFGKCNLINTELIPDEVRIQISENNYTECDEYPFVTMEFDCGFLFIYPNLSLDEIFKVLHIEGVIDFDNKKLYNNKTDDIIHAHITTCVEMLPSDKTEEDRWNQILNWHKPHKSRTGIQSVRDLAKTIDMILAGPRKTTIDYIIIPGTNKKLTIEAIRGTLRRKVKMAEQDKNGNDLFEFLTTVKKLLFNHVTQA